MPTHDDSKFDKAQARYDDQEADDDLPTDEEVSDLLWTIEGPQGPKQAEIARSAK